MVSCRRLILLCLTVSVVALALVSVSASAASSGGVSRSSGRGKPNGLDVLRGRFLSPQTHEALAERIRRLTPSQKLQLKKESRRSQKQYQQARRTAAAAGSKVSSGPDFSGVSAWLESFMSCRSLSGLGVAIIQGGEIVFSAGLGVQDTSGTSVNTDTIFGIGSCTKAFTSTLGAVMSQTGEFDFHTLVTKYLPDFTYSNPETMQLLTTLDLVTHRTGLAKNDLALFLDQMPTRKDRIYAIKYIEPFQTIRSKFLYNNWQVATAGYLLGVIGSEDGTWETLIRQRLFEPLGMNRTFANFSQSISQSNRATPMYYDSVMKIWKDEPYEWNEVIDQAGPAGSIASSTNDMARWVQTHLGYVPEILNNASRQFLHSPHMTLGEDDTMPSWLFQRTNGANYAANW